MKIDLKKDKFEEIESCFTEIKEKRSNAGPACNKIETILSSVFHKKMKVNVITPKNNKDTFFVMSIFPEKSTLDKMVEAIVNEENDQILRKIWEETNEWIIEIDIRIFNEDYIQLTAKEMTALLLHEIGHMVYSNSIPQRISKVMRYEFAKADLGRKKVLQNKVFGSVLKLPIINACTYDNYKTKDSIRKELKADVFVTKMGYGKELESALEKFIANPSIDISNHINKKSKDVYDDMKQVTLFSMEIIDNFEKRKGAVARKNLLDLATKVPSVYIKGAISDLGNTLFSSKSAPESVKLEYMQEKVNEITEGAYMTEFFDFRMKRFKRIDPRKIDYIEIQRQSIRNNDDKMILLNYIYTNLDRINYYLAILDNPEYAKKYRIEDSKEQLLNYKSRLLKSRDIVVAYKIPEVKYGIEISYPAGYEG